MRQACPQLVEADMRGDHLYEYYSSNTTAIASRSHSLGFSRDCSYLSQGPIARGCNRHHHRAGLRASLGSCLPLAFKISDSASPITSAPGGIRTCIIREFRGASQ